ncbi:glycosyl transferase family protein [Sandaracinobacteroides saxicola]|uniref:Glycosyl transferase family protein n=1 Tax=Sandaracinobacteroides saxicola TaxID=2759707 RepID=A0A7G5IMN9_9SPHN|nr:glycosyl transferase family protein [Sandaracinobacteroides saxicola]
MLPALLLNELLWLTAIAVLLSGLDDLAVDLVWLSRRLWRRLPLPPAAPLRHAIFVPAWDEAAVIGAMLGSLSATLDHPDWRLFVGCYPNDPATRAAIAGVADPRISCIMCRRPGPTTKADCLNHLWRAMRAVETAEQRRFDCIVLHDAEDVIHPAELRTFDAALATGLAMVQLPVEPLPDATARWIGGHYLDEFAEAHAKELPVRGALGAPVPSAGVATAIRRDVLDRIASAPDAPFDQDSLTEDYELGHRLHRAGHRAALVRVRVAGALVSTREYFPATLDAALRQKSRWLLGIALTGWDRLGWRGGVAARWMLLRDRKSLYTAVVGMLAYGLAIILLLQAPLAALLGHDALIAQLSPALHALLAINTALLGWRLLVRAAFATHAAGWREGLRSVPRAVVGNAINALAALRAVQRYRTLRASGETARWDKTIHRFPGVS